MPLSVCGGNHARLQREVRSSFDAGYPRDNILFQTPHRGLLYQNDTLAIDADLTRPQALIDALSLLFSYSAPAFTERKRAVTEFQERVPELARGLIEIIERERKTNQRFITAFARTSVRSFTMNSSRSTPFLPKSSNIASAIGRPWNGSLTSTR